MTTDELLGKTVRELLVFMRDANAGLMQVKLSGKVDDGLAGVILVYGEQTDEVFQIMRMYEEETS